MNNDHYDYVLKDLIYQRDALNKAIETIQKSKESATPPNVGKISAEGLQQSVGTQSPQNAHQRTQYRGMTILPALKKLLLEVNMPLNSAKMAEFLQAGGMEFESETPQNTIASVLSRAIGSGDQDIVKVDRGFFAHKRWNK